VLAALVAEADDSSLCRQRSERRPSDRKRVAQAELEQPDLESGFSKKLVQKGASLQDLAVEDEDVVMAATEPGDGRGSVDVGPDQPGVLVFYPESHTSVGNRSRISSSSNTVWVRIESLGRVILDPVNHAGQKAIGFAQSLKVACQNFFSRGLIRARDAKAYVASATLGYDHWTLTLGLLVPLLVFLVGILVYWTKNINDERSDRFQNTREQVQHMWLQKYGGGKQAPPVSDLAATPLAPAPRSWSRSSVQQHLQQQLQQLQQQQKSQSRVSAVPADTTALPSSFSLQAMPSARQARSVPPSAIGSGLLPSGLPLGQTLMCPELCIPEGNECCLLLAELGEGGSALSGVLPIYDVKGVNVLYCAYTLAESPPRGRYDNPGNGKRLVLRNARDDEVLASSCDIVDPDGGSTKSCGPVGMALLDAAEEQHAVLRPNSGGSRSGYVISHRSGRKMLVRKDTSSGFCVTDEDGWLLASTGLEAACEADNRGRRCLRISPGADAAVVILALLGAEALAVHSHRLP